MNVSRHAKRTVQPTAHSIPIARNVSGRSRSHASAAPPATMSAAPATIPASKRLVQQADAERDRDQRRRSDDDRRPRGAGVADREREEQLRDAGCEQPREGEEREVARVGVAARHRCRGKRNAERDERGDRRAEPRVRVPQQREAERDRHRSEERGGAEGEDDRIHQRRSNRLRASAAAGSETTIASMISAAPVQPTTPSRSPASQ